MPNRRYFVKGGDEHRTHNVHTYDPSNPEVTRHLDFRDYLIAHPQEAQQYATLKIALAQQFPHDIFVIWPVKMSLSRKLSKKVTNGVQTKLIINEANLCKYG